VRPGHRIEFATLLLIASISLTKPIPAQTKTSSPAATSAKAASTQQPNGAAARLRTIIDSGRHEDLRWPDFSDYRTHLTNFYQPAGYKLVWIRDRQPTPQALELIQIFQNADQEGLNPDDYDAPRWADRLTALKGPDQDDDEARFDAALTICIMRYISDLHIGRINPQNMGFEFNVSSKKLDLPHFVRERLVNGSDLRSELIAVEPPSKYYQRLRAAMQHYMELNKTSDGEKVLDAGPISPGDQYTGIPGLAKRLQMFGDLPDTITIPVDSTIYQGPLVDAVKHFQNRLGMEPTGNFDYKTLIELNKPLSDRIEQMQLGLERLRWLPYTFKEPPIIINVPEFRLYAFNEKSEVGLTMRVNVGEDYNHQTPMFEGNIQYIVFRPYWTPPPNILKNEIIPDMEKTPSLTDLNLELVSAGGKVINSGDVTPALLQQVKSGRLTVRQPPGPENGMGLVKFIFPNTYDVYIHDTPASLDMFSKAAEGEEGELKRVSSHGCIHLEYPDKFAAYVLRNTPGWDLDRVQKAMHDGKDNLQVNITPVPVLIFYLTAVAEDDGEIHFFRDIYDHDRELRLELAHGYPYPK
jgi:murein L,D-transpeptidase YcbB/YkuD